MAESHYYVRETFHVATRDGGMPRTVVANSTVEASDPVVKTHRSLLQPMSERIEQTTAAPGEQRPIRLPSGVTAEEATKARDTRVGPRNVKENDMPHALPPEHPDSPASAFAPLQPGAGVVADDVPAEQNPAGGPKAADTAEPQTADVEAKASAKKK